MIFTFAQQKGGVGKTTLAIQTACSLAKRGRRVLVIDADEQGSFIQWAAIRQVRELPTLFPVLPYAGADLHTAIDHLMTEHGADAAVIDAPGVKRAVTPSAIAAADVVVIPVQPSPLDVWACAPVVEMIQGFQAKAPDLRAAFVVNARVKARVTSKAAGALSRMALPTLEHSIARRVLYPDSVSAGMSVAEVEPGGAASAEVEAVVNDMLGLYTSRADSSAAPRGV